MILPVLIADVFSVFCATFCYAANIKSGASIRRRVILLFSLSLVNSYCVSDTGGRAARLWHSLRLCETVGILYRLRRCAARQERASHMNDTPGLVCV